MKNSLKRIMKEELTKLLLLSEQQQQVQAMPLNPQNFKLLDSKTRQEIVFTMAKNEALKNKILQKGVPKNSFDVIKNLNRQGIEPYIFMKHIQGTGEKFGMMGVYVNLLGEEVSLKLNVNNVSDYIINSLPWTLLSLNVQI